MSQFFDCRKAFAEALEGLAEADPRVVVVTNDSVGSSNIGGFRKRFPKRFINVGIAEQALIGVSAGLANGGKLPFVCGAACFLTARALEQVKVDLGYSRSNVKLCGMSGGVAYGALGPTHHSIEDLAWTRVIPNLTIIVPADPAETRQAVRAVAELDGPVFLRVSRMPVPQIHPPDYRFQIGRASLLRDGRDVTVIANGTLVTRALQAAALLEKGRHLRARTQHGDAKAARPGGHRLRCHRDIRNRDGRGTLDLRRARERCCRSGGERPARPHADSRSARRLRSHRLRGLVVRALRTDGGRNPRRRPAIDDREGSR